MSKPVAWMDKDGEIFKAGKHPNYYEAKCIPLYTHPVKQLSDEEIANIWAEHTKVAGTYDVKDIIFPFARAIIKEITE